MKTLDFASLRETMVEKQIKSRGVMDPAVLAAMRKVPREKFVLEDLVPEAYNDSPLPIEEGQTISQPYMVALMTQALELKPGSRVLEVGAGSGYAAAVLGQIAAEVYSIEYFPKLAELAQSRLQELGYTNVHIKQGDGALGWKEHAPYQGISITAAATKIPSTLLEQLSIGGKLVMPLALAPFAQELVCITKQNETEYAYAKLGGVMFVPLLGKN